MKRCTLDKIASVTRRLALEPSAVLGEQIPARAGTVIAARVLNKKDVYDKLEDVHGRMVTLHPGDIIAGALGHRDALYGFSGKVPEAVKPGDVLNLLNAGGVIGEGAEAVPGVGEPFRLEVLGSVLEFPYLGSRFGLPADVGRAGLPTVSGDTLNGAELPPVIALVGTCMDAGKTTAASVLIHALAHGGTRVAAGKLTGVSLRRDVLAMQDCGADPVALFTDFGVVTTNAENAVPAAHGMLAHLSESDPEVIVLEMGDGLLGTYGVDALLADPIMRSALRVIVLCAQDPVGAWGAVELLERRWDLKADVVSGRVTDSPVGKRYCNEKLGLAAWNALKDAKQLAQTVQACLDQRQEKPRPKRGAASLEKGAR